MSTSIPLSDLEQSQSAKFDKIGDTYKGRIIGMTQRQQSDLQGKLQTWNDGTPRMLWVINIEQDNGDTVAFWAKGGKFKPAEGEGESMLSAIGSAVRAAGASGVDVGAELAVAFTGWSEASPGKNPARLFKAQYRPPAPTTSVPVDLFTS